MLQEHFQLTVNMLEETFTIIRMSLCLCQSSAKQSPQPLEKSEMQAQLLRRQFSVFCPIQNWWDIVCSHFVFIVKTNYFNMLMFLW